MRRRFLTVGEVANGLEVHEQTVRRWIKTGQLPAYKPGGSPRGPWRIDEDDLESFLASRRSGAQARIAQDERGDDD